MSRGNAALFFKDGGSLTLDFAGSDANALVRGLDEDSAKINYFRGAENTWKRNISTYKKVRYSAVYPAVDLEFYGNGKALEYDFVVRREAIRRRLRLSWERTAIR